METLKRQTLNAINPKKASQLKILLKLFKKKQLYLELLKLKNHRKYIQICPDIHLLFQISKFLVCCFCMQLT